MTSFKLYPTPITAIRTLGLSLMTGLVIPSFATGINGFIPTDSNVIAPASGLALSAWRQVGQCGPSTVQIAPSWVLSARHARCTTGQTFTRFDAQGNRLTAQVDADYSDSAIAASDVHLSHLATPLPYAGQFVPLVDNFYGNAPLDGLLRDTDALLVGYGVDPSTNLHDLRVGWSVPNMRLNAVPANPHFSGFGSATPGDSGGGAFIINKSMPNGALAGLLNIAGPGSSFGFVPGTRESISRILSNPSYNPTGEQLVWISASSVRGDVIRINPPLFLTNGGNIDSNGIPEFGLLTSSSSGTLHVQIPKPLDENGVAISDANYRVRILREDHLTASPTSFDFSTTLTNSVGDLKIGSGIGAGTWYMTAIAFKVSNEWVVDPETGEQTLMRRESPESFAAKRVKFVIPANNLRPKKLKGLDVNVQTIDLGDGKPHWCADIAAQLEDGQTADGILWFVNGSYWKTAVDDFGGVCDTWDDTGTKTVFPVVAYPFVGAAIGPATLVNVTGPSAAQ